MTQQEDLSDGSIDEGLEWELEQGIPQVEDPFIEKYMQGREALIKQEKKQRHGNYAFLLPLCYSIVFGYESSIYIPP